MHNKVFLIVPEFSFFMSHRFDLACGLINNGYDVEVICDFNDSHQLPSINGLSFTYLNSRRLNFGIFKLINISIKLRKLVRSKKPRYIYAISHRSIILTVLSTIFLKSKLIYAISGMGSLFSAESESILGKVRMLALKWLVLLFYKYCIPKKRSCFILQNDADKSFVIDSNIANVDSVFIVPGNGLDASFFYQDSNLIGNNKVIFIMIARILRDKGVLEFLEASNTLLDQYSNFESRLFGNFDEANFNSLKYKDIEKYINKNIKYMGHSTNIRDELINSNVLVHPSYREGFSRVLMEAQACSRMVITTNVTGCRDAIIQNKTGLLAESRDVSSLINEMSKILDNPSLVSTFSLNAYNHAKKSFTVEQAIQSHIEIFKSIENNI